MSKVEDVAGESDFKTLNRWIMDHTTDMEARARLCHQIAPPQLHCSLTRARAPSSAAHGADGAARAGVQGDVARVREGGIANLFGMAGDPNSSGDDQKKLDVLSNDIFVSALKHSGACAVLVSEEDEEAIIVPEEKAGRFCVAFDPLDGSSNIDCNVSTGTIFAVYERVSKDGLATEADIMRTGNDIVAAGYCIYGAATELVVVFKGNGVQRFTLDPSLGEFIHPPTRTSHSPRTAGRRSTRATRATRSTGTTRSRTRSSGSRRTSTPRGTSARW